MNPTASLPLLLAAPLTAWAGSSNYSIAPGARPELAGKVSEWPVPTPRFARGPAAAPDGRKYDIACGQIDIGNALTGLAANFAKGVPQTNGSIAVEPLMDVAHVASTVVHMAGLPLDANVQFVTVMATKMPFVGRG